MPEGERGQVIHADFTRGRRCGALSPPLCTREAFIAVEAAFCSEGSVVAAHYCVIAYPLEEREKLYYYADLTWERLVEVLLALWPVYRFCGYTPRLVNWTHHSDEAILRELSVH